MWISSSSVRRPATVVVVGVGGAGVNAVSRLMDVGLGEVQFVAADASAQVLGRAQGARQVRLSAGARGLGTGGDARLGAAAVIAAGDELRACIRGADLVFIVAAMAGGVGGGGAPEVARMAKACGATTVGFAIMPFWFEAERRALNAQRSAEAFLDVTDTLIALHNDRALAVAGSEIPLDVALRVADDAIRQAVQGLNELVAHNGWINLDLASLRRLLSYGGEGCLSLGIGRGKAPARKAMWSALASPLVDMNALSRAAAVLVQISGGMDLSVADTRNALELVRQRLPPGCELAVGTGHDPTLPGMAQVTVLATGIAGTCVPVALPRSRPSAALSSEAARKAG